MQFAIVAAHGMPRSGPPNFRAKSRAVVKLAKHHRTYKRPLSSRQPRPRIASRSLAQCHSYISSNFLPKPPNGTIINVREGSFDLFGIGAALVT
jgi:hypothetical protein